MSICRKLATQIHDTNTYINKTEKRKKAAQGLDFQKFGEDSKLPSYANMITP